MSRQWLIVGVFAVLSTTSVFSYALHQNAYESIHTCWNGITDHAIICYYTDWSYSRQGIARYTPKDVKNTPCTHILYSFALLNDSLDSIIPAEPELDIETDNLYQKITDLKNRDLKVLLSLGGWIDSTPKYSLMMADPQLRSSVVRQTADYITKHGFDGLDVAIDFPNAYQGILYSGSENDRDNYLQFLRELREQFDSKAKEFGREEKLLLSAAVSSQEAIIDLAYDVEKLAEICDWIGVMPYSFHGKWDYVTGLPGTFSVQPGDRGYIRKYNVENAMNMWLTRGAPANKLVLGMASFGRVFLLKDATQNGIRAPAFGDPDSGKFTGYRGVLSFFEILDYVQNENWTPVHKNFLGSYAYKDLQWVGYDDTFDIAVKAVFTKLNCFFGVSFWSLDLDCFQEDCPGGPYPLIRTAKDVLAGEKTLNEIQNLT